MNTKRNSKIYLVRHVECKANVENMNLSPDIDAITDKGLLQSSLLGKHLQEETFTKAYSSTYPRAVDTAREIIKNLKTPAPKLEEDDRIREREMGEFDNRPMKHVFDALYKAAKEQGTKMIDFEIPQGESVQKMEARIEGFLNHILDIIRESSEPQSILVVTHGVIIMRMMLRLRFWSKDPSKALALKGFELQKVIVPIKNTAYHIMTVNKDDQDQGKTVVELEKLHQDEHLKPLKPKVAVKPSQEVQEITETFLELTTQQCSHV